jgi:hypothetical protein
LEVAYFQLLAKQALAGNLLRAVELLGLEEFHSYKIIYKQIILDGV